MWLSLNDAIIPRTLLNSLNVVKYRTLHSGKLHAMIICCTVGPFGELTAFFIIQYCMCSSELSNNIIFEQNVLVQNLKCIFCVK